MARNKIKFIQSLSTNVEKAARTVNDKLIVQIVNSETKNGFYLATSACSNYLNLCAVFCFLRSPPPLI